MDIGRGTGQLSDQDEREHFGSTLSSAHASCVEVNDLNGITLTETRSITNPQTSLFSAVSVTCEKMEGSKSSAHLALPINRKLLLPDGVKPYYLDEKSGIAIICGDCREILPTLPTCDLLLTDPPYGILSESGSAATRRSGGNKDNGHIAWDIAPQEGDLHLMREKASDSAIWGGCHLPLPPTFGYLIWDKQTECTRLR
jgi:hypothetical protein